MPARGRGALSAYFTAPQRLDALLDGRADNFVAAIAFNVTKDNGYRAGLA